MTKRIETTKTDSRANTYKVEIDAEKFSSKKRPGQTRLNFTVYSYSSDDWRAKFNNVYNLSLDCQTGEWSASYDLSGPDGPGCYARDLSVEDTILVLDFFGIEAIAETL